MSNYDDPPPYGGPGTAAAAATAGDASEESGVIDKQYIKGIPGLLKLLEVVSYCTVYNDY